MEEMLKNLSVVLGFNLQDFQEMLDNSCTGSLYYTSELDSAKEQRDALNNLCTNLYKNGKEYSVFELQNCFLDGSTALIVETEEEMVENYSDRIYKKII